MHGFSADTGDVRYCIKFFDQAMISSRGARWVLIDFG